MGFEAHGKYRFKVKGDIIFVQPLQSWNIECVKSFFEAYKALILSRGFEHFGVIVDLRQFEGGTPEAMAYFNKIPEWTAAHGQIARANIVTSEFLEFTVNDPVKGQELFPIQSFISETEALIWMGSLGIRTG